MKVGIFIYSLSGGGAERVVSYLLKYCVEQNIDVNLICMSTAVSYEIPDGVNVHFIEKSKPNENGTIKALKIPFLAYKYSRLIKKLGITHSLSFLTRPSFINILSRKFTRYKYKVIINERAFPSLQYGYKGFQSVFNKKMIKMLYKKADLVISNSQGNATDLINNFDVPPEKTRILHNPIDLENIAKIALKKSFFDNNAFNMVSVGRLTPGKNFELLIEAVYSLKNPLIKLYIIGEGKSKLNLEELIKKYNLNEQVILMGFESNPYQFMKAADLFIFGSNHEGFPNVLLEAMACSLPIVSTNCKSGPSEIMELNGIKDDIMKTDYGILVPVKKVESMARAIKYFIRNKDYSYGCKINSQPRIQEFNKDEILATYISNIKA